MYIYYGYAYIIDVFFFFFQNVYLVQVLCAFRISSGFAVLFGRVCSCRAGVHVHLVPHVCVYVVSEMCLSVHVLYVFQIASGFIVSCGLVCSCCASVDAHLTYYVYVYIRF